MAGYEMQAPRFITLRESNIDKSNGDISLLFGAADAKAYRVSLAIDVADMVQAAILTRSGEAKLYAKNQAPIFQGLEAVGFDTGFAPEGNPVLRIHLKGGVELSLMLPSEGLSQVAKQIAELAAKAKAH